MNHLQKPLTIRSFFQTLNENRNVVVSYVGSLLLIAAVFGSLNLMRTNSSDLLKLIQLLAFFGIGCLNAVSLQHGRAFFLSAKYFIEYLLYTAFIAMIMLLFLGIIYLITGSDIRAAFSSACAFLVPLLLSLSWFFYKHIPKNQELVWIDSETRPDELALSFRNKIPVRFQVSRSYFDMREVEFPITVSSWVKLGVLFHEFLAEQNKNEAALIEQANEDGTPYGWEFFAESMSGLVSRQLNPKLNVRENKISQSSVIVARRVQLTPAIMEQSTELA